MDFLNSTMSKRNGYQFSRFIILFLLLDFLFIPSYGQMMKGKVKSFRETYYSVNENFGLIKKKVRLEDPVYHDQEVFYDQNENITMAVEYNSDGTIYCKYKGRADYEDNHIESIFVRYYPETAIDRRPFILESVSYSLGKMCEMTYKNDSSGRPIEELITDLMGNELYKIKIKRDEKGNATENKFSNGTIDRFIYDIKGNRIEWVNGTHGDTTKTKYKYDLSGNIMEMIIDNYYKSRYKYHYDKYKYKYRYDDPGNWIERTEYENDIPLRLTLRKIVYAKEEIGSGFKGDKR